MAFPGVAHAPDVSDSEAARGWEWSHSRRASRPNIGLQATANSLRSCVASAIGGA